MNQIKKAEQDVVREQKKQLAIMNCTVFTILYEMGWDADKIVQRFNDISNIWLECREKKMTTFQLLEDETGIEIALEGERSFHDFDQLTFSMRNATPAEYIYSLHRRKRWIAPMILACVIIAVKRIDNWDDEQIEELIRKDREIRNECGSEVKVYESYMFDRTGYSPSAWE